MLFHDVIFAAVIFSLCSSGNTHILSIQSFILCIDLFFCIFRKWLKNSVFMLSFPVMSACMFVKNPSNVLYTLIHSYCLYIQYLVFFWNLTDVVYFLCVLNKQYENLPKHLDLGKYDRKCEVYG